MFMSFICLIFDRLHYYQMCFTLLRSYRFAIFKGHIFASLNVLFEYPVFDEARVTFLILSTRMVFSPWSLLLLAPTTRITVLLYTMDSYKVLFITMWHRRQNMEPTHWYTHARTHAFWCTNDQQHFDDHVDIDIFFCCDCTAFFWLKLLCCLCHIFFLFCFGWRSNDKTQFNYTLITYIERVYGKILNYIELHTQRTYVSFYSLS